MESSSSNATVESTTQNESEAGCGCSSITISVNPTTGGQFDLAVTKNDTIENLKKLISKKLKVPKERICLLHRERQLRDGTIQDNQLVNGSRLTLLPSVETGLLAQRPEQSVMQALESLNDSQVNDFLSGKAPLNLTMRLGDHMMLIQLQLSTVTPNQSGAGSSSASSATAAASSSNSTTSSNSSSSSPSTSTSSSSSTTTSSTSSTAASTTSLTSSTTASSVSSSSSSGKRVLAPSKAAHPPSSSSPSTSTSSKTPRDPLASLTSIVNESLSAAAPKRPVPTASSEKPPRPSCPVNPGSPAATLAAPSPTPCAATPLAASPAPSTGPATPPSTPRSSTSSSTTSPSSSSTSPSPAPAAGAHSAGCKCDSGQHAASAANKPTLDTRALAEASRNLTQTLKQLSSEVLTSKTDTVEDVSSVKRRQGAIIESMHHHGKGVYSGTFSGTLNPALQDRFGRPKRDISTIIHILNDLLCATPQYRNARNSVNTPPPDKTPATPTPNQTTEVEMTNTGSLLPCSESLENQATRGKMERLRLIMEERREKRRAARASPYARAQPAGSSLNQLNHTQWSAKSETQRADQPNLPMDTDLCSQPEVSPEPVVA